MSKDKESAILQLHDMTVEDVTRACEYVIRHADQDVVDILGLEWFMTRALEKDGEK